jgi:hypothetical protein
MKRWLVGVGLISAAVTMPAAKPKVRDPADYPLHVQVICSFARLNAVNPVQRVGVTIDGVAYELTSNDMPFRCWRRERIRQGCWRRARRARIELTTTCIARTNSTCRTRRCGRIICLALGRGHVRRRGDSFTV